ncbi:hypothetical protein BDP27DRAFT_1386299 [Rhodocollybia butyracea]|uniref:Transposase n=1 Tax=Rhodocollybia butyracea TaxID=206335 RepID=A0A9P5P9G6_9AGAR|nr:hypothetical protein BDP27DRAFT_1386299 [Rhodocollybia butyracea]
MAYLNAVLANVYGCVPVLKATDQLNISLDMLEVAGVLPDEPRPVRSLPAAKARLGIDPDQWIVQYAICPQCWKHHHPTELRELERPECTVEGCSGIIYTESTDSKGRTTHIPCKINPQVSLIESLHRMMQRPGFAESICDTRMKTCPSSNDDNFVMEDISDGSDWYTHTVETVRERGNQGTIRDVAADGQDEPKKLNDQRYGLNMTINCDWFGILERPHSSGGIYFAINNLPIEERHLQVNVICQQITPGPTEPNIDQIIHCLEPLAKEIEVLRTGVKMEIHGSDVPVDVYADAALVNCDTPAARKLSGTAGHSHDLQPCLYCHIALVDVNTEAGYDFKWAAKDDFEMLKHAFASEDAAPQRKEYILSDQGVRWSPLNAISGWLPSIHTILNFLHNFFLGIVAHFFMKIIFGAYMLSGAGGVNSPKQKFEDLINVIQWPSHITRLPKNMATNQSLRKADEWRRILTIAPILLWYVWMDENDKIPDVVPPIPPNAKIIPTHNRNISSIYNVLLLLCVAGRLLASRTISIAQATAGQEFLIQFCRQCLALEIPLVINHHLAMHYLPMFTRMGPVYGWWLFAFERFNGLLEKVNHNGHDGGRMELTLLRSWVQNHLLYELMLSLPPDAHAKERAILEKLVHDEARRGGMATQIAIYRSENSTDSVRLPKGKRKFVNLRTAVEPTGNAYALVLAYVQERWPNIELIDKLSLQDGTSFLSRQSASQLTYIRKNGIRYGSASNTPEDSRYPVQISSFLHLTVPGKLPHICAVVRCLRSDHMLPAFPWDLQEVFPFL